jgi:hypothetical protein
MAFFEGLKLAPARQVDCIVERSLPSDGAFATNRPHPRYDYAYSTQRFGQGPTRAGWKIIRAAFIPWPLGE